MQREPVYDSFLIFYSQAFKELLCSVIALQKVRNDDSNALYKMLLNNVCYVMEFRECVLHTLMNYNEAHSTKWVS